MSKTMTKVTLELSPEAGRRLDVLWKTDPEKVKAAFAEYKLIDICDSSSYFKRFDTNISFKENELKVLMKKAIRSLTQSIYDYLDEWCSAEFHIRRAHHLYNSSTEQKNTEYVSKWISFSPAPNFSWKLMDNLLLFFRNLRK